MTSESQQRVGGLVVLPRVLQELGVDPIAVLAKTEIRPDTLADPEAFLNFDDVGRLFQACVQATGCEHFGLLIGQRSGSLNLGLVGQLMQNAATLRQAALDLCVNQPRYVRGSVVYLTVHGELAFWGYGIHHAGMQSVEHYSEAAVAAGANMMRELIGSGPEDVLLARRTPSDINPYRRFFGFAPQFEADQNALVFSARLLARPVLGSSMDLRRALETKVAAYWALKEPSLSQRVSRILRAQVILGESFLESIARDLSLHPRTLNRRLQDEGTTFRHLVNEARFEVARQLLNATTISVAAIGHALGYADASGFTRAFERWSGLSPSDWRAGSHPD